MPYVPPPQTVKGGGPPLPAVTPTCSKCGQPIYCGGPNCPNAPPTFGISGAQISALLPLGYDQVPMINAPYISCAVKAVSGPSAGFYVPGYGR